MTGPAISIPIAALLSLSTAAGGAWIASERTEATLVTRVDDADKRIEQLQWDLRNYVSVGEYSTANSDIKRELDEIRSDVKEIRRGVQARR